MGHLNEKTDYTVTVYIVDDGKVLLQLHKKLGKWLAPGGHIEEGEDPVVAALREAEEETGLKVKLFGNPQLPELAGDPTDLLPPKFMNRHSITATHEHVDHAYFALVVGGSLLAEEGSQLRWFSGTELKSDPLLSAPVRAYALAALSELMIDSLKL